MKQSRIALVVLGTLFAANAFAYDADMAARIEPVASRMDQAALVKGGCKVAPEEVLKMLADKKEKITVLDIRTNAERNVIGVNLPGTLNIPLDQLFKKQNLDRLPTDGKILVVCHSGARAAGATALLSAAGFTNVSYVAGGLITLVTALTPKTVPLEK